MTLTFLTGQGGGGLDREREGMRRADGTSPAFRALIEGSPHQASPRAGGGGAGCVWRTSSTFERFALASKVVRRGVRGRVARTHPLPRATASVWLVRFPPPTRRPPNQSFHPLFLQHQTFLHRRRALTGAHVPPFRGWGHAEGHSTHSTASSGALSWGGQRCIRNGNGDA
jgi:hypothetical protein